MHKPSRKERKRLFIITFLIVSLISILVLSVHKDWEQILKNRKKENDLQAKYQTLLEDEERLNAEITKLQDDEYLARYAKEKYMLSKEGETIIKMN